MAKGVAFKVGVKQRAAATNKKDSSSMKANMNAVLEGLGIGSGMKLIKSLTSAFKPLISMVSGLLKIITLILSPIGNVIVGFLMPILLVLKPIAIAINQVMLPFLQQGFAFMREGGAEGFAAGIQTILLGFQAVLMLIMKDLISLVLTLFLTFLAEMLGLLGPLGELLKGHILESVIPLMNDSLDVLFAAGMAGLAIQVVNMGAVLGVNTDKFQQSFVSMIGKVFPNLSEEFITKIAEALNATEVEGIFAGYSSLAEATSTELGAFFDSAVSDVNIGFSKIMDALGVSMPTFELDAKSFGERLIRFFLRGGAVGGPAAGIALLLDERS